MSPLSTLPSLPPSVYVAGLVAFAAAVLLVLTGRWHGRFSMDGLAGVQKSHTRPTPRIGGVAIVAGLLAAWWQANPSRAPLFSTLIWAGLPAFAFGLAEDVTKRVGVLPRLLATMVSGVAAWWLTGIALTGVDVPLADGLLQFTLVSVVFTAFAVGGIANAANIIDGLNGLASGFIVVALSGVAALALLVGDTDLAFVSLAMAAAAAGFWLTNWPFGRLFLGDGGSYFCGFALAWLSVLLIERNDSVNAFVPLLLCIHPVTEVLFSIYRRRLKRASPGHPDRLHLHTLVMHRVVLPRVRRAYPESQRLAKQISNSVAGLLLAAASLPTIPLALWSANSPLAAAGCCLLLAVGYVTVYARLVRFHWCSPLAFLFTKPVGKYRQPV